MWSPVYCCNYFVVQAMSGNFLFGTQKWVTFDEHTQMETQYVYNLCMKNNYI